MLQENDSRYSCIKKCKSIKNQYVYGKKYDFLLPNEEDPYRAHSEHTLVTHNIRISVMHICYWFLHESFIWLSVKLTYNAVDATACVTITVFHNA